MIIFICFLVCALGFAIGIFVAGFLQISKDAEYVTNHCHRCGVITSLPRYTSWEYSHDCDSLKCETTISKQKQLYNGDIPIPSINAQGKTLC